MRHTLTASMLTGLALAAGLASATTAASAATPLRAPQASAPAITTVQYYVSPDEHARHRWWRYEMWRRHLMHERWRAEHAARYGYGY